MYQIPNVFTQYRFETDAEAAQAACFSDLQRAHIQNTIASYAMERANLAIDYTLPDPLQAYMLGQQKLLGAIEALQYILAQHDNALDNLTTLTNNARTE